MKRIAVETPFVLVPLALIFAAHWCVDPVSEPYFNNDETRHVMTGVFFHDAIAYWPTGNPKKYAVQYYLQYPALGLMVWPPLFYVSEGAWMTVFGTSFDSARALVALFGVVGGIYFYRLARRGNGPLLSACALALLGFSPLVFKFSRQVMLELPCLVIVLGCVFYFERYLDEQKRRDAWFACLLAALSALTRFDGVFLLLYFAIRLLMTRNLSLLKRGPVIGGVISAILVAGPYYLFTMREYGATISKTAQEGSSAANSTSFFGAQNFLFYPQSIPEQIGWYATVAAIAGFICYVFCLVCSTHRDSRKELGPAVALFIATYLFFTPIAEMDPRHAIYWAPALALFAVNGCMAVARITHRQSLVYPLLAGVIAGTALTSLSAPAYYVLGYEEAAEYVLENNRETRVCLMDGFLNGDFIYQTRRHDHDRRLWVIRGDKLLYTMLCDPHAGYKEHAREESEALALIHRHDPELIIIEEPQIFFDLPGARLLRQVLHDHPERFQLETTIPIRSNQPRFVGHRLEIWRNLVRNPDRAQSLEIEMLTIGRSLGAELNK